MPWITKRKWNKLQERLERLEEDYTRRHNPYTDPPPTADEFRRLVLRVDQNQVAGWEQLKAFAAVLGYNWTVEPQKDGWKKAEK